MKFATSKLTLDGKEVGVKELSAKQRQKLFDLHKKETNPIKIQAHVIQMGCETYAAEKLDDIMEMPGTSFDEISQEILKLSGLADDSEAEAEKN